VDTLLHARLTLTSVAHYLAGVARSSFEIKSSSGKELDALDSALFARIDRKIFALAEDPRPPGSKKLRGYKDQWRIRVGDWRFVHIIDDAEACDL